MASPDRGQLESQRHPSYRGLVAVARPLFFSSTFRDMHAERDYLRNDVFLELNEKILQPRRHELNVIDLRQGVEVGDIADEAERELAVLKVCLDEIHRTRPFLIGLLGDRYGWVPPADRMQAAASAAGFSEDLTGKSVTELELLYAFVGCPEQRQRSRIYIREMDYTGMPDSVRAQYDERYAARQGTRQERLEAKERWDSLQALKSRLLADFPDRVHTYPAKWDAHRHCVVGFEQLRKMVLHELGQDLDAHTREYERSAPQTWQEADLRLLEDFALNRTRCYVDRRGVAHPVLEFMTAAHAGDPESPWGMYLTGESGSGKSALFSHIFLELREKYSSGDILVLAHAAGIHAESGSVDRMLRR